VEECLTHNPKIEGSNPPTTDTRRKSIVKKFHQCDLLAQWKKTLLVIVRQRVLLILLLAPK
jgi:hypothetical protein